MSVGAASEKLSDFYAQMTSLERVFASLQRSGVDLEGLTAQDLYQRDLDCQNLGAFQLLEVIAEAVAERAAPGPDDHLLDVGCGMGGPGRYLADRFGCSLTGIDLLPLRIETAEELTGRTGHAGRISYRVADATDLPFGAGSFAQAWLLDVAIHVRDKASLFEEMARVLRPGGLLVMHDQPGPLPAAMRPLTRMVPYIAPTLPQLIRLVETARFRVLDWQDTTQRIIDYFEQVQDRYGPLEPGPEEERRPWRRWLRLTTTAYLTTLRELGGRTGILLATRQPTD